MFWICFGVQNMTKIDKRKENANVPVHHNNIAKPLTEITEKKEQRWEVEKQETFRQLNKFFDNSFSTSSSR